MQFIDSTKIFELFETKYSKYSKIFAFKVCYFHKCILILLILYKEMMIKI